MRSAIESSAPSNPETLCRSARTVSTTPNSAIFSWVEGDDVYILAGPIQNRSEDEVAVHLISVIPVGQAVRVDFTDGHPYSGVIRLCKRTGQTYKVRVQLQQEV